MQGGPNPRMAWHALAATATSARILPEMLAEECVPRGQQPWHALADTWHRPCHLKPGG